MTADYSFLKHLADERDARIAAAEKEARERAVRREEQRRTLLAALDTRAAKGLERCQAEVKALGFRAAVDRKLDPQEQNPAVTLTVIIEEGYPLVITISGNGDEDSEQFKVDWFKQPQPKTAGSQDIPLASSPEQIEEFVVARITELART